MVKLSVVVPVFNVEAYLREALESLSLLRQVFPLARSPCPWVITLPGKGAAGRARVHAGPAAISGKTRADGKALVCQTLFSAT
jgi:hypothetical protein